MNDIEQKILLFADLNGIWKYVEVEHNNFDDLRGLVYSAVHRPQILCEEWRGCKWCNEVRDYILKNYGSDGIFIRKGENMCDHMGSKCSEGKYNPDVHERVEMMKNEIEKDPKHVDDFYDDLKKKVLRGHPRFHELVQEMSRLHSKKNHDYAGKENPLNNLLEVKGMGIPAWVGVAVRISDKYTRMKNFIKNRHFEFKDESFKDTLMDMAVYALLCIILFEEDYNEEKFLDNIHK